MISDSDKIAYWKLVEKALVLLGAGPELAHELRNDVKKLTADQQELFYNAEPLTVAHDLCGLTQLSQQEAKSLQAILYS